MKLVYIKCSSGFPPIKPEAIALMKKSSMVSKRIGIRITMPSKVNRLSRNEIIRFLEKKELIKN